MLRGEQTLQATPENTVTGQRGLSRAANGLIVGLSAVLITSGCGPKGPHFTNESSSCSILTKAQAADITVKLQPVVNVRSSPKGDSTDMSNVPYVTGNKGLTITRPLILGVKEASISVDKSGHGISGSKSTVWFGFLPEKDRPASNLSAKQLCDGYAADMLYVNATSLSEQRDDAGVPYMTITPIEGAQTLFNDPLLKRHKDQPAHVTDDHGLRKELVVGAGIAASTGQLVANK